MGDGLWVNLDWLFSFWSSGNSEKIKRALARPSPQKTKPPQKNIV